MLALCQSETDAGAHWQMVMKLYFYLQIKLGGLWGCFRRDKKELVLFPSSSSTKKGETVSWFALIAKDLFRNLAHHQDLLSSTREKVSPTIIKVSPEI